VLGALAAVFERFCPMPAPAGFSGNYPIRRKSSIAIYHRATGAVSGLPPCEGIVACPACLEGRPCPRAELLRAVAPGVFDPKWVAGRITRDSAFRGWLRYDGVGGWFSHRLDARATNKGGERAGPVLSDATTSAMLRGYLTHGDEAERVASVRDEITRSIDLGNEDPWLVEHWAERLAAGGREEDLRAAIEACDAISPLRPDPPDSAWISLAIAREALASRLARMTSRKVVRPDGTVEEVVPHNPGLKGRRARPLRFVRP
jgi:hypothetical protein